MKRIHLFCLMIIVIPYSLISQEATADTSKFLSQKTFNYIFARSFGKFATGQENMPTNYASFDPTNPKFILNGFISLRDSTHPHPQFVSLSISGALIDGNTTSLFTDKKLNNDVSIDLKYHFLFRNKAVNYFKSEKDKLNHKLEAIKKDSILQRQRFNYSVSTTWLDKQIETQEWKLSAVQADYANLETAYDSIKMSYNRVRSKDTIMHDHVARVGVIVNNVTNNNDRRRYQDTLRLYNDSLKLYRDSLKVLSDSASGIISKMNEKVTNRFAVQAQLDSLNIAKKSIIDLSRDFVLELKKNTAAKQLATELESKVNAIRFSWFSGILAFKKRKYYTYYDSLPFKDRLSEHTLDALSIGLEWNFLYQGLLLHKTHYFNIGVVRRKYNNLDGLSTTDVDQAIETTSNDTTRTISKKYAAFTEGVNDFHSWFIYSNYYFFWGKVYKNGVHLFPEFEFRNNEKKILNIGIGLIVSFKDEKKDKSILNVEAYSKFSDISNQLKTGDKFYERLEIGVRVGLPIKPF